jgi:hypothetical protein
MTYKERIEELKKVVEDKFNAFTKFDREIASLNSFGDIGLPENYQKAYREWQEAANEYHNFVIQASRQGMKPEDQYR